MLDVDGLTTAAATDPLNVTRQHTVSTGLPDTDTNTNNDDDTTAVHHHLHAPPHPPPPSQPLQPLPPLPQPPASGAALGMASAGVGVPGAPGAVGGGDGGQVMIHWTQSGPSVQPVLSDLRAAGGQGQDRSADQVEDPDEDDDELLAPTPPRERLSYTRYQLELLNGIFKEVRYPNSVQKQLIAKRVGISREQVKIWFQNRRRKDVVLNKTNTATENNNDNNSPSSSQSPASPPSPTTSSSSPTTTKDTANQSTDVKQNLETDKEADDQKEDAKPRMVPEAVINGCITELKRFSDEKLKERKEKRKAKGKRRASASASNSASARSGLQAGAQNSNQPISRLFQAYDMVAPPNKVTPTAPAFLDTSANRFNHSHNSSAFSSPRDHLAAASSMPRLAWDGLDTKSYGGLGSMGLGTGLMPPMSQTQSANVGLSGSQESLPVLSDLLTYRQQGDGATAGGSSSSAVHDSREASLPQASLLSSSNAGQDPGKLLDLGSVPSNSLPVAPPSPFSMNRVYPFPFIADPPIMLSSLHQHDPLHHWPHPHPAPPPPPPPPPHFNPMASMNGMDPYKSVRISSLSNPYFSNPPPPPLPPHSHWSSQPGSDPTLGPSFTQL